MVPVHFHESARSWYTYNRQVPYVKTQDAPSASAKTIVETRFSQGQLFMTRIPVAAEASGVRPSRGAPPQTFCDQFNQMR